MKYFLLFFTLIYLVITLKGIFSIKPLKESVDIINEKSAVNNINLIFSTIITILYLFLCIKFINNYIFAIIGALYIIWSLFDLINTITYIQDNKIAKTFNSKIYVILSKPFDLAFPIYMLYQLFIKFN